MSEESGETSRPGAGRAKVSAAVREAVVEFLANKETAGDDIVTFCARFPEEIQGELRTHLECLEDALPFLEEPNPLMPEPPRKRLGDYRVISELGRGGMGIVYSAEHEPSGRIVAVKVMRSDRTSPQLRQRFRREQSAVARLDHPAIVRLEESGTDGSDEFMVMELVEGVSLAERLEIWRAARMASQPIPSIEERVGIVRRVAEALTHAHEHGVIHRDIKPANILLSGEGQVFLTDFGLAFAEDEETITLVGDVAGTMPYMSPEQALARRAPIDHRTDIYSLGVVLYEILTLERPFRSEQRDRLVYDISFTDPPPLRAVSQDVSAVLQQVCLRALTKNPAHRYPSIAAFNERLAEAVSGRSGPFSDTLRVAVEPTLNFARRHPRVVMALALIACTVAVATIVYLVTRPPTTAQLSVGGPSGLQVWRRAWNPVDDELGAPESLGALPLDGVELPPGPCWLTVGEGDARFEWPVLAAVGRGEHHRVELGTVATTATSDMVRVSGGSVTYERFVAAGGESIEVTTEVADFEMDRTEVANGIYRAFLADLAAAGEDVTRHRPTFWPAEDSPEWRDRPDDFDRLPVTDIEPASAIRFARWQNKRLPTVAEWLLAAGGAEGQPYPWGAQPDFGDRRLEDLANVARKSLPDSDFGWREYLNVARPVDWRPQGAPFGEFFNLVGNVAEFTATMALRSDGEGGVSTDWARITSRGHCWASRRASVISSGGLMGFSVSEPQPYLDGAIFGVGFRCVRSVMP